MAREIDGRELALLKREGAEITRERRAIELDGLESLVSEFRRIAEATEAAAVKQHGDLKGAIDALTKAVLSKEMKTQDLTPVLRELVSLQKGMMVEKPRPSYDFDISRNRSGHMTKVRARPVSETKH